MAANFVKTNRGDYLVQVEEENGEFYLCDDEQSWPGGFGIAEEWEVISANAVPEKIRDELEWIIEENK